MNQPSVEFISQLFDQEVQRAHEAQLDSGFSKRWDTIWISKLPFCGLRSLHDELTDPDPHGPSKSRFQDDLFGNMGQGFHWSMQKFLGRGGNCIANWVCKGPYNEPHDEVRVEWKTYRACPKCGGPMRHQELKFQDGAITGKIDFLWVARLEEENLLYLVDFKSTGDDRMADFLNDKSLRYFPSRDNVYAMESYVPLVEAALDRKLAGWMLFYSARSKLNLTHKVIHHITDDDRAFYAERNRWLNEQMRLRTAVRREDQDRSQRLAALDDLIREKPCESKAQYDKDYHNFFSPCPLKEVCFSSERLLDKMEPLVGKISK